MSSMDARIPVLFGRLGDVLPPETAVLVEGDAAVPGAAAVARYIATSPLPFGSCGCCAPRGPVARALGGLFMARARGEAAFFRRVVVMTPHGIDIKAAIAADVLLSARFRIAHE